MSRVRHEHSDAGIQNEEPDEDPKVPPPPGVGSLPKYARGGRRKKGEEVKPEGHASRHRHDRPARRQVGGAMPGAMPPGMVPPGPGGPAMPPGAMPAGGAAGVPAAMAQRPPMPPQVPPPGAGVPMSSRGGRHAEGGRTTPSGGVKASYRHKAEEHGHTMAGGSFPIEDAEDLRKAKHDVGRAHNPAAARRWIDRRAKELGEPGLGESKD
jgi:hypothetical protein